MNDAPLTFIDGRITIDPAVCNGRPTIRGKRIAVQTILEYLAAGDTEAEILLFITDSGQCQILPLIDSSGFK